MFRYRKIILRYSYLTAAAIVKNGTQLLHSLSSQQTKIEQAVQWKELLNQSIIMLQMRNQVSTKQLMEMMHIGYQLYHTVVK